MLLLATKSFSRWIISLRHQDFNFALFHLQLFMSLSNLLVPHVNIQTTLIFYCKSELLILTDNYWKITCAEKSWVALTKCGHLPKQLQSEAAALSQLQPNGAKTQWDFYKSSSPLQKSPRVEAKARVSVMSLFPHIPSAFFSMTPCQSVSAQCPVNALLMESSY